MSRWLFRSLASLLVVGASSIAILRAQDDPPKKPVPTASSKEDAAAGGEHSPVLATGMAILGTMGIMLIICMPSRKG